MLKNIVATLFGNRSKPVVKAYRQTLSREQLLALREARLDSAWDGSQPEREARADWKARSK